MEENNGFSNIIENIENVNQNRAYNIIIKNKNTDLTREIISENIKINNCINNKTYIIEYEEYKREIDEFLNPIYTPFLLIIRTKEILKFLPFGIFKD